MAKLKVVIRKNKVNKDGLTTIQIAISHKQETAYISTNIDCIPDNFVNGSIIKGEKAMANNAKVLSLLNKYQEELDKIDNISAYSAKQIKERLTGAKDKSIFLLETYALYKRDVIKNTNSRKVVEGATNILRNYLKGKDVMLVSVDQLFVSKYRQHLETCTPITANDKSRRYSASTIAIQMNVMKTILRYAEKLGMVRFDVSPFALNKSIRPTRRNNFIDVDEFIRIRDYVDENETMNVARDLFLLSFYLGGMNLVDMLGISYKGEKVVYKRRKIAERTNGQYEVCLPITSKSRGIIDKYMDKETGLLDFDKYTNFKLRDNYDKHIHSLYCMVNDRFLGKLKALGICSKSTTFYSARKCFAQIGTSIGISDSVINYILGHTNNSRGIIQHYSGVSADMAEVAMELITEFAEGNQNLKEIYRKNLLKRMMG